jgi:hypothetical protein
MHLNGRRRAGNWTSNVGRCLSFRCSGPSHPLSEQNELTSVVCHKARRLVRNVGSLWVMIGGCYRTRIRPFRAVKTLSENDAGSLAICFRLMQPTRVLRIRKCMKCVGTKQVGTGWSCSQDTPICVTKRIQPALAGADGAHLMTRCVGVFHRRQIDESRILVVSPTFCECNQAYRQRRKI